MKKILLIFFFLLLFSNYSYAKVVNIENKIKINIPDKFYLVNFGQLELADEMCKEFSSCYGIVDRKIYEIVEKLNSGVGIDEIQILKPLISKYQKLILTTLIKFIQFLKQDFILTQYMIQPLLKTTRL